VGPDVRLLVWEFTNIHLTGHSVRRNAEVSSAAPAEDTHVFHMGVPLTGTKETAIPAEDTHVFRMGVPLKGTKETAAPAEDTHIFRTGVTFTVTKGNQPVFQDMI
jgi:3D (Asp-Asp-Asp) domain-containing protein